MRARELGPEDSPHRRRRRRRTTVLMGFVLLGLFLGVPTSPELAHPSAPGPPHAASLASPFLENVRITDGSSPFQYQVEPYIAVNSSGTLFVGWKEALTDDGPGRRVGFASSQDGGQTWSSNLLMDRRSGTGFQSDPWLVVDETDRLYFVRLEFENGPVNGIGVTHSDDGGESWSPITDVDDQSGFADKEAMASDGNGTLYLAYGDVMAENTSMRFAHSTDRGANWTATVDLAGSPGPFASPVVASRPNGTVYVAWLDWDHGRIFFARSWDRGVTWGPPVQVNPITGTTAFDPTHPWWFSLPSIVADSQGRVYVAWPDRALGDLDVVVARSKDDGASWSSPVRINDDGTTQEQRMVSLAVDPDDRIHAAWYDNRTGNLNVFYSSSTDGGGTWSANERVTTEETPSTFQRPGDYLGLAVDGNGTAYIAWTDGRGLDLDIYFAKPEAPSPSDPGDLEAPTIEILSPQEGQNFTTTPITVSGTAEDNVAVERVELSVDLGTTWIQASGTSSWSGSAAVPLGDTVVLARAIDTSGNDATAGVTVSLGLPSEEAFAPDPFYLLLLAASVVAVGLLLWWRVRKPRK
ncbi:MAG: exo-alpha-sialidase [Thermoplasmata archaeon]